MFVGLWMERSADKKLYRDMNDLRRQKSKGKWGWGILMFGIFVEILTAAGLSAYDVCERRQTASRIEKIDPRKQPVTTASALAHLEVTGFDLNKISQCTGDKCSLSFHPRGTVPGAVSFHFDSDGIIVYRSNSCLISFTRSMFGKSFTPPGGDTVGKVLDAIDTCCLDFATVFASTNFMTTGGDVTLTLNSEVQKRFVFPPQQLPSYGIEIVGVDPATNHSRVTWKMVPEGGDIVGLEFHLE